jgi:hypothetical protein
MTAVFVDTVAFVAINNKNEQFNAQAVEINRNLLLNEYRYITSDYVLDETVTLLRKKAGHAAAVDFYENIQKSELVQVVHVTETLQHHAWNIFKKYADKEYSFTDCTSFAIMKELKVHAAFTNDHHFEQMGFDRLIK